MKTRIDVCRRRALLALENTSTFTKLLPLRKLLVFAMLGLWLAPGAEANLLENGSFELASVPAATDIPVGSTAITGWVVTRAPIGYVEDEWVPSDGSRSLDLDGTPGAGGIAQTFATVPGATYLVTFDMAGHPVGPPTIKPMGVQAAGQSAEFAFDVTGHSEPDNMGWVTHTWSFVATDTQTTLEFFSLDTTTGSFQGIPLPAYGPALDNVQVILASEGVDHFLGYKTQPTKGATEVFTPPPPVRLTEHSGSSALFDVKKRLLLYTPANKNSEGVLDENTHLEAYLITLTKTAPPQPKPTGRKNAHLQNQFGEIFVDVGKPDRLLVPTAKNLTEPADLPGPNTVDHYRCDAVKTIKGAKFIPILGVSIDDQFTTDPGKKFDLKKLSRLCTPVKKNDEAPINNPTLLLCYKANIVKKEPKHEPRKGVHLHNQFGQEQIDTVVEAEFCVPTTEVVPGALANPDTDEADEEE